MNPFSRYYVPVHFKLEEFLDPETFKAHPVDGWRFLDPLLLMTMDRIRERYGKLITINNWEAGGQFKYRGFRPSACTEGAPLSAHRRGMACDFDVAGMVAQQVRDDIAKNPENFDFNMINVVESTLNGKPISWVHIATEQMPDRIVFLNL